MVASLNLSVCAGHFCSSLLGLIFLTGCTTSIAPAPQESVDENTAWLDVLAFLGNENILTYRFGLATGSEKNACGVTEAVDDSLIDPDGFVAITPNRYLYVSVSENFRSSICQGTARFYIQESKRYVASFLPGRNCVLRVYETNAERERLASVRLNKAKVSLSGKKMCPVDERDVLEVRNRRIDYDNI